MKRCLLHIGTHKTGTSSIQNFFTLNEAKLSRAGILVPNAGRPAAMLGSRFIGHHNIAWELNEDPRFDPRSGGLDDLLREIASADHNEVVISSEDFEYLHARPDSLRKLRAALQEIGYSPTVLVYLRNQVEYAESLYFTLLHFGLTEDFETFVQRIVKDGAYTHHDHWVFQFNYSKLLHELVQVFGHEHTVVRAFDVAAETQTILADVLSMFHVEEMPSMETLMVPRRLNTRISAEKAGAMLRENRADGSAVPPQLLTNGDLAAVAAAFRSDNEMIAAQYGLKLEKVMP